MAYPQSSTVTKSNMLSDFNTLVITARNNAVVWHSTNSPFYPNNSYGTLAAWDGNPLDTASTTALGTGDLPSTTISATEIYNAFVNRTVTASQIRTVRLIKYLNRSGYPSNNGYIAQWDQTQVSSVLPSVGQTNATTIGNSVTTKPTAGAVITASVLDTFVSQLVTTINNAKATALTYSEYYCHSSCHSSCHGSRGRR